MSQLHLDEVLILTALCSLNSWTKSDFENELLNPDALISVALNEQKVLGFIVTRLIMPVVEIFNIAVLPKARRLGIGNALLQNALQKAQMKGFTESWLEVRESNYAAQNFYLMHNYHIVGRRRNYYLEPVEDAFLMTLVFSDDNPKK